MKNVMVYEEGDGLKVADARILLIKKHRDLKKS